MSYHTVPALGLDGAVDDTFTSFTVIAPVPQFTLNTGVTSVHAVPSHFQNLLFVVSNHILPAYVALAAGTNGPDRIQFIAMSPLHNKLWLFIVFMLVPLTSVSCFPVAYQSYVETFPDVIPEFNAFNCACVNGVSLIVY